MESLESRTRHHISTASQQEKKEICPEFGPCLFWIMTVENSSRGFFFVEPHGSAQFLESGL